MMKHISLIFGLLLMAPHAGLAGGYTVINGPMPLIGTAPQTPRQVAGFTPAPVPNQDIVAPRNVKVPVPGEPEFAASLTKTTANGRQGEGYAPGSQFSETMQRGSRGRFGAGVAPSIGLQIPLEK
jgi:hypothetical protein